MDRLETVYADSLLQASSPSPARICCWVTHCHAPEDVRRLVGADHNAQSKPFQWVADPVLGGAPAATADLCRYKQKDRAEELKRQAGDAEAKLTRLCQTIENGLAELDDSNLKGRITELKRIRDAARGGNCWVRSSQFRSEVAPRAGLEPATIRLTVECSTS
jgi:hypothetical protein